MKTHLSTWLVACWLPLSIMAFFTPSVRAQKIEEVGTMMGSIREDTAKGLEVGLGIGLDFSSLSMINPRPNEGQNATNAGGLFTFFANYTGEKSIFDLKVNMQLAAQRLGASNKPFVKTSDVFQISTIWGRKIKRHLYLSGMMDMQSQFLFTYGNGYLNSNKGEFDMTSEPFSPVKLKLMPGILYRPNPDVKFLLSCISSKMVIVANDYLASKGDSTEGVGVLGNPYSGAGDFKNINAQWGAELRGEITKKLFKDRVIVSSVVDLYSNYLKNPENVAFEWYNSIDLVVFKNLSINLKSDWFYDHNILVNVGGDPNHLGRRMFIRNAAFLKFNAVF
jgi:Protein of unknown function (DUF3078)